MNHSKPLVGVGIAVVAALALTGCSGGGAGDDEANNADAAKLESLSIMAPFLSTNAPEEDNEIETALEEVIGVDLDMTWVPNASYGDKVNITLAGDDLPQVMVIQGKDPGFVRNAEAGAFWDLTEYLDDYENLKTTFPEVQRASSVNGKVYGVFRARDVMREAVIIRKDWLENVGLELPETTEDLYEIAKAFTEDDPDGNGADDTYGLIIPKWPGTIGTNSPWDAIETWYGAGTRWTERDGELVPNFTTDEWLEAVQFERQLVEEGVVNPDYATFDSAKWNEPFLTGKGGIIIDVHSRVGQLISLVKQSDPENFENFVDVTGNLTGPDGELYALPTSGYSGFLAIPKAQVRTEAELRGVLEVLNELNSAEAGPILNNGIEDRHLHPRRRSRRRGRRRTAGAEGHRRRLRPARHERQRLPGLPAQAAVGLRAGDVRQAQADRGVRPRVGAVRPGSAVRVADLRLEGRAAGHHRRRCAHPVHRRSDRPRRARGRHRTVALQRRRRHHRRDQRAGRRRLLIAGPGMAGACAPVIPGTDREAHPWQCSTPPSRRPRR